MERNKFGVVSRMRGTEWLREASSASLVCSLWHDWQRQTMGYLGGECRVCPKRGAKGSRDDTLGMEK